MALIDLQLRRLEDIGNVQALLGAAAYVGRWGYATADAPSTVEAAGYFNGAASRLAKNHIIDALMGIGTQVVSKRYVVVGNTGSVVTIAVADSQPAGGGVDTYQTNAPAAKTVSVTLTPAELLGRWITGNQGGGAAAAYTL